MSKEEFRKHLKVLLETMSGDDLESAIVELVDEYFSSRYDGSYFHRSR